MLNFRTSKRFQKTTRGILTYAGLAFFIVFMLFPFFWMLITSVKPVEEAACFLGGQAHGPAGLAPRPVTIGSRFAANAAVRFASGSSSCSTGWCGGSR